MKQERNDLQSGNGSDSLNADKVFVFICPYLGTLEDSDTSLAYPAAANHCFRVKSPAAVDFSHQEAYCLTDRHPGCHVFQKAIIPAAVPETESADFEPAEEQKRRVSLYALPLILILILLAAIVWWPAPGSNIQEALVFGDQAQGETREDTNLTGDIVPELASQTSPVEAESSSIIKATAPAVSLRESPTQKEEGATTFANGVENGARDEGVQTQAPPEAGNPANSAVQAQAPGATGTTVRSQAENTESGESPSESPKTETITLAQPAASTELDASPEAEIESPESSASDLEPSIETASVGEEAPSANIQDAAVTAAAEEVEQTAETEEESVAISIADLPIIADAISAITAPTVASTDSSSRNERVIFVGPGLNTPIALSASPDSGAALLVRRSPSSNGDLITLIDQREEVTLLGRDSGAWWLKIRLASGEEGWVSAVESHSGVDFSSIPAVNETVAGNSTEEIVISAPEPEPIASSNPIIRSAVVDTGALNIRSGPGMEYEPLTIVNNGVLVGLLGRRSSGPWVRIRLDNGVEGWVNSLLLTQES